MALLQFFPDGLGLPCAYHLISSAFIYEASNFLKLIFIWCFFLRHPSFLINYHFVVIPFLGFLFLPVFIKVGKVILIIYHVFASHHPPKPQQLLRLPAAASCSYHSHHHYHYRYHFQRMTPPPFTTASECPPRSLPLANPTPIRGIDP